jgi:MSHA biogenesis protein MshQ
MAYLRSPNGVACSGGGTGTDPAARATFGVYTPEAKRLIHTREVFN